MLDEVYAAAIEAGTPRVVTDYATAELVKVAANAFLATKISFINAMAEIAEATGADVTQLADAIGHDARIGRRFLNAGLGFGGGCLPKDIRGFMARADELGRGESLAFLREVDAINMRRGSAWSTSPRAARRQRHRQADRGAGAARSSRTPTTCATRPRWTWPGAQASAPRSSSPTRRRSRLRGGGPEFDYRPPRQGAARRRRRPAAHRVARVPRLDPSRRRTRGRASGHRRPQRARSRQPGARPGGTFADSAGPDHAAADRGVRPHRRLSHGRAGSSTDGSIDWLCLPRFDSASTFGALLGDEEQGHWRLWLPSNGAETVHVARL